MKSKPLARNKGILMENVDRYELLYQSYRKEMESFPSEICMDYIQFSSMLSRQLKDMSFIEIESDNQYGFLYYHHQKDEAAHIRVPVYGYYAENEKMMVRLFQKLANVVDMNGTNEFSISIYSHDCACMQALHTMQFGNMAEKCIKKIESEPLEPLPGTCIRELNKEEIESRWAEVWNAVNQIVLHLTKSPVFYKGEEFTEEAYRDFFMGESVHAIAALAKDRIVGIIEWNDEANPMISASQCSANVGEAFVYPEFRGTGLAKRLLRYAESAAFENGAKYMWVEHGTANPEARGFWNKYFSTYQYELIRTIVR